MIEELNVAHKDRTKGCIGWDADCRRCHPLIVLEHVRHLVSP